MNKGGDFIQLFQIGCLVGRYYILEAQRENLLASGHQTTDSASHEADP